MPSIEVTFPPRFLAAKAIIIARKRVNSNVLNNALTNPFNNTDKSPELVGVFKNNAPKPNRELS